MGDVPFPVDDWRIYVIVVLVGTIGSLVVGKFKRTEPMTGALKDVIDAIARIDRDVHDTLGAVRKCHEQADVVLRKLDSLTDQTVAIAKQLGELNAILALIVRRVNKE